MTRTTSLVAALLASLFCFTALADKPARAEVDFVRDIQPIFAERCNYCHGEDEQEGSLRLDAKAIVNRGGVSGPLFEPGKGKESLLYKRLIGAGDEEQMPLDDEPLSDEQIALVVRWIDEGAHWPEGVGANVTELEKHWAYVMPERPALPEAGAARAQVPFDRFVFAKLEEEGLEPSPPADPARLVRRVYLDLIGLPPSVEEVDAFVKDPSPEAYEEIVDRLLASPRYGEKWARHWLDLARYSDSNGFQADQLRDNWAYRDWVIGAMNADMPFDQFTIEQIAGDLLPKATLDQKIATGFHRLTTCNVEAGVDPEENRTNQVIDRVNTTGTVWLGTSLECAQCHNHKYDPFTQKDYYQVFAFFNNTPLEVENGGGSNVQYNFYGPKLELPLGENDEARKNELEERLASLKTRLEDAKSKALAAQNEWEAELVTYLGREPATHVLEVSKFESSGGCTHQVLEDGSILVGGKWPSNDTYTVTVETTLTDISGFRVEALTHPSLPDDGPGRGDRPNIVLNELNVSAQPTGAKKARPVELHSADADFSQDRWDVAGAIDGNLKTGWAINPEFGKPHWLTVRTESRIGDAAGTTLTFELIQNWGRTRTIGRLRLSAMTGQLPPDVPADIMEIIAKPKAKRTAKESKKLADAYLQGDAEVSRLTAEVEKIKKQLATIKPDTTLVMVEIDKPRMTHIFRRGNFLTTGEQVSPEAPAVLHSFPEDAPRNRLGFARWLVSRENPLVARVAVNRWWANIFGRGIVRSAEDFGTQGDPPSHPKLLDWLAVELMDSGWSMKHIHKLIVMSATYQQSARVSPSLLAKDPANVLLARGPRFRLPAELIRDTGLTVGGLLSTKMGGPPVYPPQPSGLWRQTGRNEPKYATDTDADRYRRGVYVIWRRAAPYPSFVNFDGPDRTSCVVQRPRTNTPMQALTLLNDEAFVEMAKALAARVLNERGDAGLREQLTCAFRVCVARQPTDRELKILEQMYRDELKRFGDDPSAAEALFSGLSLPQGLARPKNLKQWAAWFCVANALLNLDETVTKG